MLVTEKCATLNARPLPIDPSMQTSTSAHDSSIFALLRTFRDWTENSSNNWSIEVQGKVMFHLRVANTPELRKRAFRFGKKRYQDANYSPDDNAEVLCSRFDAHPDTLTLLIFDEDYHVVGTSTLIKDHPTCGLPVDGTFQVEAEMLRLCGKQTAEVVRLAIDPSIRGRRSREILIHLLNFSYIYAKHVMGCDGFLITVNPKHAFYYERALGCKRVGVVKPCPKVRNAPAALLYLCFAYASARGACETGRAPTKENKGALYPFLYGQEVEPLIASYLARHHRPMGQQEALSLGLMS